MAATHVKDEAKFHDTRQLLDELDALMDQMLALPINDQQEHETSSAQASATVTATLTMLDSPAPAAPSQEAPGPQVEQQSFDDRFEDRSREHAAGNYETPLESSAPTAEPTAATVLADVAAPPKVELLPLPAPVASARWRPDHISYQFLLWINQGYDGGTRWLGKPGRLLRSRAGKALLGFAGLGLLGLAAAWLAKDWVGWN